ncbi:MULTISPECIES: class I SAM-dependent methyltransferase [Streptomyces]|uniref:Methyltransferase domain-containing protein n=1 Tax=Streptomyces caniscabiei TaxID=2746961 RepID=A0ABU4MW83_9ACTN|nr:MULTISPECIES: methyltransferase domain-containing protein [Streptomyces]MBE4737801.1 methyltransferase domain-containing protein [Streptomyces caniscabiei]MBE4757400.1 methyltransferase domain-containing protein [Streptomyces caniscabiei]MBE4769399.1 methyltransferase domain-containing protein [Streptomyces caniscabiei]MBE4784880.1 methyltransferase domain-containing protein [Streptomyces caniscabiei]MBE4795664.1 methyltransferase domain-containing protein [Streptomyces caniscabiei]
MSIMREFLRSPRLTGAVAPSSPTLAKVMTAGLDLHRADVVVELGSGTGAITGTILRQLAPGARLITVELNPAFARRLTDRYADDSPVEVVQGSAEDLATLVPRPVDVIVSGLPWTVMPHGRQRRILDAVAGVLRTDGRFSTFAYCHAAWTLPARRFAAELTARFSTVERSPVIWPNLPPAFVHRALTPTQTPLPTPTRTPQHRSTT